MGICATRSKNQKSLSTVPVSLISPNMIQYSQKGNETNSTVHYKSIVQMQPVVEVKDYDPNNPHRQFNVLINGVHFEIINSVEEDLLAQYDVQESL